MVARSAVIAAAGRSNGSSPGWAIFAVSWSAMSAMPSIIWASFISGVSSFCSDRVYEMTSSRRIIDALAAHHIGTLVIGKNDGWKQQVTLGKRTNQTFVMLPHARFIAMLTYK